MSGITVSGPDGSTFSFPEGTPEDTITDALKTHYGTAGASGSDKDVSSTVDVAKQFPIGVAAGLEHAPFGAASLVDMVGHGVEAGIRKLGYETPEVADEIRKRDEFASMLQQTSPAFAVEHNTPAPQTEAGQIARGAGEGLALGGASSAGKSASEIVGNAVAGTVAGASSQAAQDVAPDSLKPVAGVVGGLAGGAIGLGVSQVPRAVGLGIQGAKDAAAPLTEAGQQQLAAERLQQAATSKDAAAEAIDNAPGEVVSGSKPTTFQQTGDMGLGALEREAQTKNPADFMQRRADQNAAQVETLKGLQSEGSPEQVAGTVRDRLDQIDRDTQAAVDQAAQDAHSRSTIMSGTIGERATGLGQASQATADAATARAQGATQAVGLGTEPEAAGATIRSGLETARAQAKDQERQLWNAVDPDGTLALAPLQTKTIADKITAEMPVSAGPMGAAETAIHDVIGQYGDAVPLREMSALRTRVGEEISAAKVANNGIESALSRRLGMLYHAVGDDLQNAVAAKVENESQAVAQGKLSPEQTLFANVQKQVDAWRQSANSAGGALAQSAGNAGAGATSSVRSGFGGQGAARSEFSDASGNQRLSADATNFDQDALDRLNAARGATAQRAATFDNKTLAPIRARPSGTAPYNMPAAGVAARVFVPGPKGFETLQTYRQAVNDPAALDAVQQYAIDRLRNGAMRPDGTLDPVKAAAFQRRYSDALRAFPELSQRIDQSISAANDAATAAAQNAATTKLTGKMAQAATLPDGTLDPAKLTAWRQKNADALAQFPDLADKFKDVQSASDALAAASANRNAALVDAQKGALGKIAGVDHPDDVTKTVGSLFSRQDPVQQFTKLSEAVSDNPEAQAGLRKSVVDYMTGRFIGNTEAATSGIGAVKSDGFQTFVRQNKAALKAAGFTDDEIGTMNDVAADLQRANRSNTSVKLPAGSNTAQDGASLLRQIAGSMQSHAGLTVEGAGVGAALGSIVGPVGAALGAAAGGAAGRAIAAARQAGFDSVDKIIADAMLNPGRAKVLLQMPLTPKAQMRAWGDLASMYKRATVSGIAGADQITPPQQRRAQ